MSTASTVAPAAPASPAGADRSPADTTNSGPVKEDWLDRLIRQHEATEAEQFRQAHAAQQAQHHAASSSQETQTHTKRSSEIGLAQAWQPPNSVLTGLPDFGSEGAAGMQSLPVDASTTAGSGAMEDDIMNMFNNAQVSNRAPAYDFSNGAFSNVGFPTFEIANPQGSSITASQFMSYMFDPLDMTEIFDVQVNPGSVDLSPEAQDDVAPASVQQAGITANASQYDPQLSANNDYFLGSNGTGTIPGQLQTEGLGGAFGSGLTLPQTWPPNFQANSISPADLTTFYGRDAAALPNPSSSMSSSQWQAAPHAESSPDTVTKLSEDRNCTPETAHTTPGSSSAGGPADATPRLTSNTKRKVGDLEAPPAVPGAKIVAPEVFAQRQVERQAEARKAAKSVIDVSVVCGVCSHRIANALFHYSDSYEQVTRDYELQVRCNPCNEKERGKQPQQRKLEGGADTKLKTHYQDCDTCETTLGSIKISSESDRSPAVELVCVKCESQFSWCSQCGGGSKYRTGKWRPKKLFLPGRKTCKLRSVRLAGTPTVEIYDLGDPNHPLPQEIIDGMRETFEAKFLFRFAKPQCKFVLVL